MAKRSSSSKPDKAASAFDALVSLRKPSIPPDSQTVDHLDALPAEQTSKPPTPTGLAKSVDPDYIKFTTYVRKDTHRAVKVKLTERDEELSDLVEQLLQTWLHKNK